MLHFRGLVLSGLVLLLSACSPTQTSVEENPLGTTTPDISGVEQTAGEQQLRDAGLRIGTVTLQSSDTVPIGSVVRTNPPAGTVVPDGSTINIIVSSGTATVVIPSVVGNSQTAATTLVIDAGLEVAAVLTEASDTVPAGEAIRTIPAAGESLARGSGLTLVMSTGPADVMVPDVVNLPEAQAVTQITDATLVIGDVAGEASDVVAAGSIVSQSPVGGAMVSANTAVDLVVSLGPANIAVPVLSGLPEAQAIQALTDLGLLVGEITTDSSVDFAPGDVITQDPGAGTLVAAGTPVSIVVSVGPNPLPVPDIVGLTEDQANAVIPNAGLAVGDVTRRFDTVIAQFEVISQSTPAGTLVQPGATLDFVVSLGVPVPTPNLAGLTRAEAEAALIAALLVVGEVTESNDFNVPAGQVISQNPGAGFNVPEGTAVDFVISLGSPMTTVPPVAGLSRTAAEAALIDAVLTVGTVSEVNSDTVAAGLVISQSPQSGEMVIEGSAVDLVVSLGPVQVNVPDLTGLNRADAAAGIAAASLTEGATSNQNSDTVPAGRVIGQTPVAGSSVPRNSAITLVFSSGPSVDSFSDEFDIDSLTDWTVRHQIEGTPAQYTTLDINQTNPGALTVVPDTATDWRDDADAPLIFKTLAGDFAVQAQVNVSSITSPGQPPGSDLQTAGLMARSAAGATQPENHVLADFGRQLAGASGSAAQDTVNGVSNRATDAGDVSGSLVLCRIGDVFSVFRRLNGQTDWEPLGTFGRPDLPEVLQVGVFAAAASAPADLDARFEYIRLLPTPITETDCTP